jgi:hypothetical protein
VVDDNAYLAIMVVYFGFIISNPKQLEGLGGFGNHGPPPPRFDGCLTKILSTSLGIFACMLIRSIPLGVCGLDFIPTTLWANHATNGT